MLGRHQAREHLEAAGADHVVMVSLPERSPAQLADLEPPAIGAVFGRSALQVDHPVRQAVQALVPLLTRLVVAEQRGGTVLGEVLL
jgi:hypothetical protein